MAGRVRRLLHPSQAPQHVTGRTDTGDRVKILCWDRGGFVLYYKRLEAGRFRLPPVDEAAQTVQLDATQLAMLLDGIEVAAVKRPRAWAPGSQPPGKVAA
jgi:transposase